jgi:hypothetical protein
MSVDIAAVLRDEAKAAQVIAERLIPASGDPQMW